MNDRNFEPNEFEDRLGKINVDDISRALHAVATASKEDPEAGWVAVIGVPIQDERAGVAALEDYGGDWIIRTTLASIALLSAWNRTDELGCSSTELAVQFAKTARLWMADEQYDELIEILQDRREKDQTEP